MYKLYCDDTALKKTYDEGHHPIFLYGGILISREDEINLSNLMKEIKKKYTGEDMPVKYNLRDVEEVYTRFERQEQYRELIQNSVEWRTELIERSLQLDYKLFISCIENSQPDKKEQKVIRQDLSSYLFANTLMRVGLYVAEKKIDCTQVILDWPSSNDSKPFDKEYYYAYNRGKNCSGQDYFCHELKNLGFDQTLYYARCHHSNLLQFTDIIMGSTRDWIETELQEREFSYGKSFTKLFLHKFYGHPRIYGYGINVSSGSINFKKLMVTMINENVA